MNIYTDENYGDLGNLGYGLKQIQNAMIFLRDKLEESGQLLDKSLLFQDPYIIKTWGSMAQAFTFQPFKDFLDGIESWEGDPLELILGLLCMREVGEEYRNLRDKYEILLFNLLKEHKRGLGEKCVDTKGIDTDEQFLKNAEDLNKMYASVRSNYYIVLTNYQTVFMDVIKYANSKLLEPYPSHFSAAFDVAFRLFTKEHQGEYLWGLKEELNRHFKKVRTAPDTAELWSELLTADEQALKLASEGKLAMCNDPKQEHWSPEGKLFMDENAQLMDYLFQMCITDRFIDIFDEDNIEYLLPCITEENIYHFFYIVVRRNLIQCQLFPEMKARHEAWLNKNIPLTDNGEYSEFFEAGSEADEPKTASMKEPKEPLTPLEKKPKRLFREYIIDAERTEEIMALLYRLIGNKTQTAALEIIRKAIWIGLLHKPSAPSILYEFKCITCTPNHINSYLKSEAPKNQKMIDKIKKEFDLV